MKYSLDPVIIEPNSNNKPKNVVILCHGYGGDGKDIAVIANYWKNFYQIRFLYVLMPQRHVKSTFRLPMV